MKNGSIALLFQKHEAKAKKIASSSPPILVSVNEHELSVIPEVNVGSAIGSNQTPFVCDGSGSGSAVVEDDASGSDSDPVVDDGSGSGLDPIVDDSSTKNLVKNQTRNRMCDEFLNDCLVTFIEREIFSNISEDDIIHTFMAMRKRKAGALD